jgi:hypothetical protein
MKVHRGSSGIVLFLNSELDGVGGQRHAPAALLIERDAGWTPWPGCGGVENLSLTGIRPPDRAARSHSLVINVPVSDTGY